MWRRAVVACGRRVGVEYDRELDRDQRIGTEDLAGRRDVLHRDEVGVRARRAGSCELEHLRTERGEHARVDGERVGRAVEPVEELDHLREGLAVTTGIPVVDERRVAHTQAQQEARPPLGAP